MWPEQAAGHAMLARLMAGEAIGPALDAALALDMAFDMGSALRHWIAAGAWSGLRPPELA